MSELKQNQPCQFCRKVTRIALTDTEDSTVYAYCETCGATSPSVDVGDYMKWSEHYDLHPQRQEIIDDTWNTRKPEPGQPTNSLEGLLKRLDKFAECASLTQLGELMGICSEAAMMLRALREKIEQPAAGRSEPVAWLHDRDGRVDVIHDSVRQLWLKVVQKYSAQFCREIVPCMVEHYTIPLYTHPIPAAPAVPDGWKLMPIEPTEAMLAAGECSGMCGDGRVVAVEFIIDAETVAEIYSNVIAASPNQHGASK